MTDLATPTGDGEPPAADPARSGAALVDAVAAGIRERILSGDIPIGAQLRQSDLAAHFGVSRMPVREALRQLQAGRLIEVHPNRGAVVRVPAPWEVREAFEARAELEALAVRRAARRISRESLDELRSLNDRLRRRFEALADGRDDPEPGGDAPGDRLRGSDRFHGLIAESSGNTRLRGMISELQDAFPRNILARELIENRRYCAENFAEHDQIVDALAAGEATLAGDRMREHVLAAGEQLARWFEQRSSTVLLLPWP